MGFLLQIVDSSFDAVREAGQERTAGVDSTWIEADDVEVLPHNFVSGTFADGGGRTWYLCDRVRRSRRASGQNSPDMVAATQGLADS